MAFGTRWIKIVKDVWSYRSRSILVILSIAIGVATVGMINNAGRIIQRDLYGEFRSGNPAHLQLYISPFQKELATSVKGMREVGEVEARRSLDVSIQTKNSEWEDLDLYSTPDVSDIKVNRFQLVSGIQKPGVREVLLERQSALELGIGVGDEITIKMPNDRLYLLRVVGIIHDVYIMPMAILGKATAYISMDTLVWLGERPYYNQLDIIAYGGVPDKDSALKLGALIRDRVIEPAGYMVYNIRIPGVGSNPGDHWGHNQIKGFLLILQIMGILAVFLSGGLVVNTVSAILTQQIKQIGIMRSFGAVRWQLAGMYLVKIIFLSLVGLVIALPLGLLGAWWLSEFAAGFLNFNVGNVDLPIKIILLQVALGLLMPVAIAFFPVISGTRISVYDAIYQYGLSGDEGGWLNRLLAKIRQLSPTIALSLRNTFRKKVRLTFTLITLTLAGAMFISAFSTRASLTSQIKDIGRYSLFDAELSIPIGANRFTVEREALRIPDVTIAEGWAKSIGVLVGADGNDSAEFELVGLPYDSITIDPLMIDGNWLNDSGSQKMVINQDFLEDIPGIRVGDQVTVKVDDRKRLFEVVGVVSKHLSGPRVYMDNKSYDRLTGRQNQVDLVRVVVLSGKPSKHAVQDRISGLLKDRFENASLNTGSSTTQYQFLNYFSDVFNIILIVLVIMASLLAIVGGLGLSGSMGMNVIERTREIGVLRAVGASNAVVRQVVVIEGIVVGLISWLLGAFVSAPSGWALASAVIFAVLKTQPRYEYSIAGMMVWLALVVLIGIFSSLAPAYNAARLRVRDVLDYE